MGDGFVLIHPQRAVLVMHGAETRLTLGTRIVLLHALLMSSFTIMAIGKTCLHKAEANRLMCMRRLDSDLTCLSQMSSLY